MKNSITEKHLKPCKLCPNASFDLKTLLSAHFSGRHIHREWKSSLSPTIKAAAWMPAVEAGRETELDNEHTGRVCLVVQLSVISKYCNQETGAGS